MRLRGTPPLVAATCQLMASTAVLAVLTSVTDRPWTLPAPTAETMLALVGLVLGWLVFLVTGFAQSTGYGIAVLILGPILVILYLAFVRMTLAFYLAIVRMSEDIHQRLR